MDKFKFFITDLEAFYTAVLSEEIASVTVCDIVKDINDTAFITITCEVRDLFWLGYMYGSLHIKSLQS